MLRYNYDEIDLKYFYLIKKIKIIESRTGGFVAKRFNENDTLNNKDLVTIWDKDFQKSNPEDIFFKIGDVILDIQIYCRDNKKLEKMKKELEKLLIKYS